MKKPLVVVHPDAETLAVAAAARLLTAILDAQSVRRPVHVCLTGGTIGIELLAAAATSPLLGAIDWSGVHLWWGDERYLPTGSPERNDTQAAEALLELLVAEEGLPEANIHPIPGPDATGSPEEAATRYAATLDLEQARFDVCLLGMGPDGHVASLFPGHPALMAATAGEAGAAIAVHDSPKPPPTRVSLTLAILNESREVWLVVAGCEKAEMVAAGLERAEGVPAGMVGGRRRTLWLLDTAAADSPN